MVYKKIQKHFLLPFFSFVLSFIATSSSLAQSDNWIYKTNMPTGRTFLGACVVDEKFYVIGGAPTTTSATTAVEMYDPATDTWQKMANMPAARCYPKTCALNGKIYVFGGASGMWSTAEKSVYLYDPQTDTWTQKSDMPHAAGTSGVAVIENTIYLIGHSPSSSSPPISIVMAYDAMSDSWTQKADIPTPRGLSSACVIDGKIYVIGGTTEKWETVSYKHVEVYDPATNTWTRKADMPTGRWGLATVVVDGLIYAIGGRYRGSSKNEAYNPVTDTWVSKSSMQQRRVGLVAGVIGNKIYATGGHQSPPTVILSSLEQYNPVLTGLDTESGLSSQPQQFILYQNYSNPFNPITSILYELPQESNVSIKIYNSLGNEIRTLVNEVKPTGQYKVNWDGTDNLGEKVSGGTYFCQLHANGYSQTRKMVLLK